MSRLASVIVVICLLAVGCINAPSKDGSEQVLRQFLDFSKEARPTPILVPIRPFVEFQFAGEQVAMADSIYNSTVFGEEPVSRKDFPSYFVAPLFDYSIISIELEDQKTRILVSEERYEEEEFFGELLGGYYGEFEVGLQWDERRDEIERFLADRFFEDFERNYGNALTVSKYTDEVLYVLEQVDGEYKIRWDEKTSKRAEREKAEAERVHAERQQMAQDRATSIIPDMRVVRTDATDYGPSGVFINVVVKNAGDAVIDVMDSVQVFVELLDGNGLTISSQDYLIGKLQPNHTERALVYFRDHEAVDWSGMYRVRIGNKYQDIYSEWSSY